MDHAPVQHAAELERARPAAHARHQELEPRARPRAFAEEIRMLVEQSRKTGGLGAGDARLLEGVFEFSEKNAREVMTPRTDIVALPADAPLAEAADRVAAAGRSRYPVTGESLDDVVGIVHAKDILRGLLAGSEAPVQDIARPRFSSPAPVRWKTSWPT